MTATNQPNQQAPVPGSLVVPWRGEDRRWGPSEGREVLFGRNGPEVHLCVGGDDLGVSRIHGVLTCRGGRWWLSNTGRRQVEIDDVQVVSPQDGPAPLPEGYTSLRVHGCAGRHPIELLVVGAEGWEPVDRSRSSTIPVKGWPLRHRERLAVVAIAEHYLRGEMAEPEPRTWGEALETLRAADPEGGWNNNRSVENVVGGLRMRMAAKGEEGLVSGEEKVAGDTLKRNLIKILRDTGTISRRDLQLIYRDDDA